MAVGVLRALVLAALAARARVAACPERCECARDSYTCPTAGGSVTLRWQNLQEPYSEITITCEGTSVSCDDLGKLDFPFYLYLLNVRDCPPSVLPCVKHVIEKPLNKNVALFNMSEPLTSALVADLTRVRTLEIRLSSADASIPFDAINSLTAVQKLHIYGGNLQHLPSNRFNHTTLEYLHLNGNNVTNLPVGFFNGLSNLKELTISSNKIDRIGAGALQGLDKLESLSFNYMGLKSIQVGTFSDTPNLRRLDSLDNPLQAVPNELLQQMPRLRHISILYSDYGGQMALGSHAFAQLPDLEMVMIDSYNLDYLSDYLFHGSHRLKNIYLMNGAINHLSPRTFANLSSLDILSLYNSSYIRDLPDGVFSNLTSLTILNLVQNIIQDLPARTFVNLKALNKLALQCNKIEKLSEGIFDGLTNLKTLTLTDNRLRTVPPRVFTSLTSLTTLMLDHNSIYELPEMAFHDMRALETLILSNNNIEEVPLAIFSHLNESLEHLDLSNNKIIKIDVYYNGTTEPPLSPFSNLLKLNYLDLSNNQLRRFVVGWELATPQLQELLLRNNQLTSIEDFNVNFTNLHIRIKLQNNNISNVVLEPHSLSSIVLQSASSNSSLELAGNPINCDCNTYGLYQRLKGYRAPHEPNYDFPNSICNSPPHLRGLSLDHLSPRRFNCDLLEHCSNNCSCVAEAATNQIVINCSRVPPALPDLTSADFPYVFYEMPTVTLKLDYHPDSIEGLNITTLILSHNNLRNITFMPTKSLKILDLSHNNLMTIPDAFFDANVTIYLANNSVLECDCEFAAKWKVSGLLGDLERVACANGQKLEAIDVYRLCNRTSLIIGLVAKCAIGVVLLLIAARAVHRHAHYVGEMLCGRKSRHLTRLEKKLDAAKQFDLFISFAHQDTKFVTDNLLPKLENEFNQKVCVHFRDWVAGELIADQIIQSVDKARRTIIVLSVDFLLSDWSYLEFRTAHNLSIQEGKPRVIIILLNEDIVNDERLTNDLKSYIAMNTYLRWDDPNFWTKMKEVLPRKGRK